MTNTKSINLTLILAGAVFLLIGYNMIEAWTAPAANTTPPANNVPAPINEGTGSQTKSGVLGVGSLAIFSPNPRIQYVDETAGHRDLWQYLDANTFFLLTDRTGDNSPWTGDAPHPMKMYLGATSSDDYVQFSDQVRANEYCDVSGGNCIDLTKSAQQKVLVGSWLVNPPNTLNNIPAAKSFWNKVVDDTYNNFPAGLKSGSFKQECAWNVSESHPTEQHNGANPFTTQEERMSYCSDNICEYYPGLLNQIPFSSEGYHCGNGTVDCPAGAFRVSCIY